MKSSILFLSVAVLWGVRADENVIKGVAGKTPDEIALNKATSAENYQLGQHLPNARSRRYIEKSYTPDFLYKSFPSGNGELSSFLGELPEMWDGPGSEESLDSILDEAADIVASVLKMMVAETDGRRTDGILPPTYESPISGNVLGLVPKKSPYKTFDLIHRLFDSFRINRLLLPKIDKSYTPDYLYKSSPSGNGELSSILGELPEMWDGPGSEESLDSILDEAADIVASVLKMMFAETDGRRTDGILPPMYKSSISGNVFRLVPKKSQELEDTMRFIKGFLSNRHFMQYAPYVYSAPLSPLAIGAALSKINDLKVIGRVKDALRGELHNNAIVNTPGILGDVAIGRITKNY